MPTTDVGEWLRALVKDIPRLQATIRQARQRADALVASIKRSVTPRIGIGLLHGLAQAELVRLMKMTVKTTPSELCGQARFLRGLIVSCPLDPEGIIEPGPAMADAWHGMEAAIADLWQTLFWIERLEAELAKLLTARDDRRIDDASAAASYGRTDIDIGFVEAVEHRCRMVFEPLDRDFVIPTLGLSTDQLQTGFLAIKQRMDQRLASLRELGLRRSSMQTDARDLVERAMQRALSVFLEIVEDDLPSSWKAEERRRFLDLFAIACSGVGGNFVDPKQDNITLRKPLLQLSGGRYLLMDPIFCRYAPFRLLTHYVEASPFRARFHRLRDQALERLAVQLISEAVKPSAHYAGAFLPVGDGGALAEQDHIFVSEGHAFFVECKAKRVRSPVAHGGNATKVQDDLGDSIAAAFDQGNRARRHLMSSVDGMPVFDKHRNQIGIIDRASIQTAHVIVVTWDSLCPLSVDLKPWLSVPSDSEYPWAVSVDDLQTALTRMRGGTNVARFIAWRSTLNGRVLAGDEMHVVGCFLADHTDIPRGFDTIVIDGSYAETFDDDYLATHGVRRHTSPAAAMPAMVSIVDEDGLRVVRLDGKVLRQPTVPPAASPGSRSKVIRRFKRRRRRQ